MGARMAGSTRSSISGAGSSACALRSVTVGGPSAGSSKSGSLRCTRSSGASDTSAATPLKTVWQWPQRTWPARSASCGVVTRKIVLQPGQRVNFSSAIVDDAAARERHPSFFAVPDVDSKPSPIRFHHRRGLRLQYSRQNDVSACAYPRRKQRRKQLQGIGQDIRDYDVVRARVERIGRIEARCDAVEIRIVPAGGDRLRVDIGAGNFGRAQLGGGNRQNPRPTAVVEYRLATSKL